MIQPIWHELPIRFPHLKLDEFAVMLNHVHGIFVLRRRGESCIRPDFANNHQLGSHELGEHKDCPYGHYRV
jgi:hypothetical protein